MKKYVSISLFVFWAIVVAIMVAGLVFYDRNKTSVTPVTVATSTPKITPPAQTQIVLTTSEVAKHQSANDCWLIINNNVYNVTSYLNFHPAGAGAIIPYCGQDGTQAFDTKGGRGQPHSNQAQSLLDNYLIGPLGQSVSASQTPILSSTSSPIIPPSGDDVDDENELEDD